MGVAEQTHWVERPWQKGGRWLLGRGLLLAQEVPSLSGKCGVRSPRGTASLLYSLGCGLPSVLEALAGRAAVLIIRPVVISHALEDHQLCPQDSQIHRI